MEKTKLLLSLAFIMLTNYSFSQKNDSTSSQKLDTISQEKVERKNATQIDTTKKELYVKGVVTFTNKGISYIPNLSLGKPAVLFDMSLANKKLSFEPQLRFSFTTEPWAFLFPVRYKIKSKGVFQLTAGINPLLNFKSVTFVNNGVSTTELVNRRYLGTELRPNFFITKNISAGLVYLYFFGVSTGAAKNTHFISLSTNFSKIKLGKNFFAKFNPQVYYLNQDEKDGFYFNSVITLLKRNFPFSIQTNMNATIETDIPKSEKFIWNVSLIYTYNRTYTRNEHKK